MISTCSQLRAKGRADLNGRWAEAAMFTFVMVIIAFFASCVGSALNSAVFGPQMIVVSDTSIWLAMLSSQKYTAFSWVAVMLLLPMAYSANAAYLSNHRAESDDPFGVGNLFTGYRDFWRVFGTMFIVELFVYLFSLMLIIPGIWMALRLALTPYILRDHPELKGNAALRLSADMMQGHKWKLLGLGLSFIGWALLCILTLGIGLFWLNPYMCQTFANFYEEVKADYEGNTMEFASKNE